MPVSQRFRALSEGRRERETFRYDPSLMAQAVHNDLDILYPPEQLRASPDPALTAFAELAVLRLHTSRALISLFDRNCQYIVAEATPSLPLRPSAAFADHEVGENLVLCGTAIPRASGICELALGILQSPPPKDSLGGAHVPMTVIPDLAADPRSSKRTFCHLSPETRFYSGVPLRTPKGIDIGVLCVFDTEPRADLDSVSRRFLQDLAQVVMDYLVQWRQRENYRNADRMARGLGSFVEGKSTIAEETTIESPEGSGDDIPQEGCADEVLQYAQRDLDPQLSDIPTSRPSPSALLDLDDMKLQSASETLPLRRPGPSPIPNPNESKEPTTTGGTMSYFSRTHAQEPRIQHIFSTASNVIREAIDVEHVLFLEASIRSFGGLAESTPYAAKSPEDGKSSSSSSFNEEFENTRRNRVGNRSQSKKRASCRALGFSSPPISSIDHDRPPEAFSSVSEGFLAEILQHYPKGKIFNFDADGKIESSDGCADEIILGLDAAHPRESSIAVPEESRRADPSRERSTERIPSLNEGKEISNMFPGARSVAIVPLWDTQKHRWYAGGFVCSMNPARTFTPEHELSYLRAFGIILMAKVDRLEVLLTEKSKTDLLGSLSHELRSPLHGIILGAELLYDTSLDRFQGEMLDSIETCGRTLLETMDHLLDFSRINNFIGSSSNPQLAKNATAPGDSSGLHHRGLEDGGEELGIEAGMMRLSSNVEVDVLAEEVVESVCAGFIHQQQSIAHLVNEQSTERAEVPDAFRRLDSMKAMEDIAFKLRKRGDLLLLLGDVAVTFDINPAVSWAFHTQSGAIRRIIMNLVGNSLKFTSKGTVSITVNKRLQEGGKPSTPATVEIIVTDTGRGISENYLHNHLFSPFCQEDSLSAGLGLGLSLVNQTVAKLGGSIRVLSKPGQGTKVTVVLPLQEATASPPPTGNPGSAGFSEFRSLASQLKGLRVRLLGLPAEHNVHGDGGSDWLKGIPSEGAILTNICTEWLCMHIVEHSIPRHILADLIITTEASLAALLAEERHGGMFTPVVVICRNALIARQLATSAEFKDSETIFEFISQPLGPRKLAKVLLLSLKRWIKSEASAIWNPAQSSLDPTPSELAPDPSISLTPAVEYFCEPFKWSPEIVMGPAKEDGIVQDSQREDTVVQGRARADHFTEESEIHSGGLHERQKGESGPIPMSAPPNNPAQQLDASRPRFLLVDDNPINLRILISYIKKLGYRFACASNGLEAFKAFEKSRGQDAEDFKFVLMDISMPVMDGLESTRRIRAFEMECGMSRCNIFALTGLASASAQQEAFASGIDLFLTKPVRLKEISKILESKGVF